MKGTYLTCRYVDDLGGFGPYFSLSLIACFHPTLLLLLSWFLLYFVGSELDLLLVVIGMREFEQGFKLTVNLLTRWCRLLFRLISEIDLREGLGRVFDAGKLI